MFAAAGASIDVEVDLGGGGVATQTERRETTRLLLNKESRRVVLDA
jgi:hypothetical protein